MLLTATKYNQNKQKQRENGGGVREVEEEKALIDLPPSSHQ